MSTFKNYKYQLFPTKVQKVFLNKHFGCCRKVYNHYLAKCKKQYEETGKSDGLFDCSRDLTQLKKEEEFFYLNEVACAPLHNELSHLDTGFKNFFSKRAQHPRFKTRHSKNSFTTNNQVKTIGNKLYINKFQKGIKFDYHREVPGIIKHCVVSRTPTNKYFVSICCAATHTPRVLTGKQIGIDVGLTNYLVTSDGDIVSPPKYFAKHKRELGIAQFYLARKKEGSMRRQKQRLKVSLIHEKIANSRLYFLHTQTSRLVKEYDVICTEDLDIKEMTQKRRKNRNISRGFADAGLGKFFSLLDNKMGMNGQTRTKVARDFPSTKTCFKCGVKKEVALNERSWVCGCGEVIDRDHNAAKNILREGLALLSASEMSSTRDLGG